MGNFESKHLFGLVWLCLLIIVSLGVLLFIRKQYQKGDAYDIWAIKGATLFIWG
jgi:hypothetical protein